MKPQPLFNIEQTSSEIILIYSAEKNVMPASDLGEAIIGLELCLKEVAKIGLFKVDPIVNTLKRQNLD